MNTAELQPSRFTMLGVSDDRTECDCCGKSSLKRTVAMRRESDGEVVYYGCNCAAEALKLRRKYSAKDAGRLVSDAKDAEKALSLREGYEIKAQALANTTGQTHYLIRSHSQFGGGSRWSIQSHLNQRWDYLVHEQIFKTFTPEIAK